MANLIDVDRLIERLRNDTFEVDSASRGEADLAYRRGHNNAMYHVEHSIIPYLLAEQRINKCLDELMEADK